MPKGILAVLAVLVLAVVLAGCGGSNTIKAAANPQTRADVAKAEVIVKQCVTKSRSKTSRQSVWSLAGEGRCEEQSSDRAYLHSEGA